VVYGLTLALQVYAMINKQPSEYGINWEHKEYLTEILRCSFKASILNKNGQTVEKALEFPARLECISFQRTNMLQNFLRGQKICTTFLTCTQTQIEFRSFLLFSRLLLRGIT
jgi:hypothetical protein